MKISNSITIILTCFLTVLFLVCGTAEAVYWPLRVSVHGKYLEDQNGDPYPIIGDTAWSMAGELSPDDVILYLNDRQNRGFTAIIVNAIEREFSTNAPNNHADEPPFTNGGE